ncbi:MAG: hypothetical protein A2Y16_05875 [Tenericutes bacterium GWF2_57_13]|nr:MAG: hypothetical protein A2Y16_05875 [Tenericutes bacterium GWF2_57_13]
MKNNKSFNQLFTGLVLAVGILATFMLVLPALKSANSDSVFIGFEVVFGTEFANLGGYVTGNIVASFWGMLAYLLPISAALVATFVKKGTIVALILFALSAAMLLTLPDYTVTTVTILDNTTEIDVEWTVAFGLVIASVCSFIGIGLTLYKSIMQTKND